MVPGLLRLLPLPLGLLGGALGALLWWLCWLANPELWRELDEIEGYVIFGTMFLGWGLLHGCFYLLVPPFRAPDPRRAAVSYRARRMLWLYALPVFTVWAAAILAAVLLSQPGSGIEWQAALACLILSCTLCGTAWVTDVCCDWIQPRLPREVGAVVTAGAILVLSFSLGLVLVTASPFLWETIMPRGNITAMDAAMDFYENDLEILTPMLIGPAVHGGVLAVLVPTCEAIWNIPAPRRRDLGGTPWLLLVLPVLACFDLMALVSCATYKGGLG